MLDRKVNTDMGILLLFCKKKGKKCQQLHYCAAGTTFLKMVDQSRRSHETGMCVNPLNGGYDIWTFVWMSWICWFAKPWLSRACGRTALCFWSPVKFWSSQSCKLPPKLQQLFQHGYCEKALVSALTGSWAKLDFCSQGTGNGSVQIFTSARNYEFHIYNYTDVCLGQNESCLFLTEWFIL